MDVRIPFLLVVFGFFCVLTADCARRNGEGTKKPANRLVRPLVFNPKNEWDNFVRQAERNELRDRELRRKMMRNARILNAKKLRGPKGPRGPQGPPGAVITKREMMREFRKLMKELVENRMQIRILDGSIECTTASCNQTTKYEVKKNQPPLFAVGHVRVVPKVTRSFTWKLSNNITVESKKMEELSRFQKSTARGSHTRCIEISPETANYVDTCSSNETIESGRYMINRTGIYTFFVSLHFLKDQTCVRNSNDRISTILCIDSLCDENMSLKTTSSLEAVFTESVAGFLYLKKGQYISIYVDNMSGCLLNILDKSYVSGILTGV